MEHQQMPMQYGQAANQYPQTMDHYAQMGGGVMQQPWGPPIPSGFVPMPMMGGAPQYWGPPMPTDFAAAQTMGVDAQSWGPAMPMGFGPVAGYMVPLCMPMPGMPLAGSMPASGPELGPVPTGKGRGSEDYSNSRKRGGKGGQKGKRADKDWQRRGHRDRQDEVPKPGVSISRCSAGDLTRLQDLWVARRGKSTVTAAWKVDNPLLVYEFKQRRDQLKEILSREADTLEGFHGTMPDNVISICENGFDKGRRSGQVYGAGEYFAKDPTISVGYSRGGQYMLVCRLTLGVQSSTEENEDGDHIWVPSKGYYVIKEPAQILPQFIIKFESTAVRRPMVCQSLEAALGRDYSTKQDDEIIPVPRRQRPCEMAREAATVLWMGFLHAHLSDDSLRRDVHGFLQEHAAEYLEGAKIQIVKGHYKKAHVILRIPMPRALVHRLNAAPFFENGVQRTICVEDAHGSPGQKCPRYIAGYCRGQNLRYTHPCFCDHPRRATEGARFTLEPIDLSGAKGSEIRDKFMSSAPFHNGRPTIVGISAIKNDTLSACHEEYRRYLRTKHMEEPAVQELYHGTNNNILATLYRHGLQPPSDTRASESCPLSGGKGLSTTLCGNACEHCTQKHEWDRCHMFGLGIYLADMAQKSHRYVSQPQVSGRRQTYRMIVCSVLGKAFQIEGHLRERTAMHDVVNVRALDEEELDAMIEPCRTCGTSAMSADSREGSAEKSDLLLVKGLGDKCRPGFSVVNSEIIAFHPHQCLPKYEIEYELNQ